MRRMLHPAFFLCLIFSILSSPGFAAEVTNLRTHFSSTQLTIEYDLTGKNGDKSSSVEVLLKINGNRYSSNMLSLAGDFGRSIVLGKNRRIIWKHTQDFPEGLDTTFTCIVNAVPNDHIHNEAATPSDGFRNTFYALNRQTVTDSRTNLMWTRNASITIRPMLHSDAEKLIEKFNQERYAGYNDWRIPTHEDLEGLVLFGKKAGWGTGLGHFIADYLATCGFTGVQPGNYWTSTKAEKGRNQYYAANTWNGIIRPLAESNYYYLWPVRTVQ